MKLANLLRLHYSTEYNIELTWSISVMIRIRTVINDNEVEQNNDIKGIVLVQACGKKSMEPGIEEEVIGSRC